MAWDGDWFGAWMVPGLVQNQAHHLLSVESLSGSGPRRSVTSDAASRLGLAAGQALATIDPGRGQRWMTVPNMSGEVIPAWSALEPHEERGRGDPGTASPRSTIPPRRCLGSGSVIGIGDYGVGTNHMATWALLPCGGWQRHRLESLSARGRGSGSRTVATEVFGVGWSSYRADGNIVTVQRDVTCRALQEWGYYYGDEPCGRRCCCWRRGANRDSNPSDTSGFTGPIPFEPL